MRTGLLTWLGLGMVTAWTANAQFASGMGGGMNWGGRGGGLYGVTRRTPMMIPNVNAARYFQVSGLPLVNPQNLNLTGPNSNGYLAARGSGTEGPGSGLPSRIAREPVVQSPGANAVVGGPSRSQPGPAIGSPARPAVRAPVRGLAQVDR